jgi:hypothetical protein
LCLSLSSVDCTLFCVVSFTFLSRLHSFWSNTLIFSHEVFLSYLLHKCI